MATQKKHAGAIYWVGPEVEHTPGDGKKTLFVTGVRAVSQMIEYATLHNCSHVHLGASNTFQKNKFWNDIVPKLLDTGLKVTLEYPLDAHDFVIDVLDADIWSHHNFIPVINCKIQKVEHLSKNLYIKIDDAEFDSTNDAVWTLPVSEILDINRQTLWQEYSDDIVLTDADVKKDKKIETMEQSKETLKEKATTNTAPKKKKTASTRRT